MESKYVYTFKDVNEEVIKVFLPKFEIDMDTMKQIKFMAASMTLKNIRIMPDCHKGHGCCVGLTALIKDKVFPRYVGVDIGCGISMYPLNIKLKSKKIPKVERLIRDVIPMGTERHKSYCMRDSDWEYLERICDIDLLSLKGKFPDYEFPKKLDKTWITEMMNKIGGTITEDFKSVGTLGGGNHYVEINGDTEKNYITVHSGSRSIGYKICMYHQHKIDDNSRLDMDKLATKFKAVRRKYKVSKVIKSIERKIVDEEKLKLGPKYLEGDDMMEYLVDMIVGQNIATLNRVVMIRNFVEKLMGNSVFDIDNMVETRHNYIDFNRFVLRKGSISAEDGELCIISLNMRDGVLLCRGKGNPDWNYSSAHGCGRILNRTRAARLDMKTFKKEMEDVYSTCVRKETLDESPMAYRDVDLVKNCLRESVDIIEQLKPVINCKGY